MPYLLVYIAISIPVELNIGRPLSREVAKIHSCSLRGRSSTERHLTQQYASPRVSWSWDCFFIFVNSTLLFHFFFFVALKSKQRNVLNLSRHAPPRDKEPRRTRAGSSAAAAAALVVPRLTLACVPVCVCANSRGKRVNRNISIVSPPPRRDSTEEPESARGSWVHNHYHTRIASAFTLLLTVVQWFVLLFSCFILFFLYLYSFCIFLFLAPKNRSDFSNNRRGGICLEERISGKLRGENQQSWRWTSQENRRWRHRESQQGSFAVISVRSKSSGYVSIVKFFVVVCIYFFSLNFRGFNFNDFLVRDNERPELDGTARRATGQFARAFVDTGWWRRSNPPGALQSKRPRNSANLMIFWLGSRFSPSLSTLRSETQKTNLFLISRLRGKSIYPAFGRT